MATDDPPIDERSALTGIRILDFTRYQQGPFATMLLAEMGAEVVKVEEPGGEPGRANGRDDTGFSAYFEGYNRSKKSMTLDLRTEEARDVVRRLVPHFDVVVENFRPGIMEKWGLGYQHLKQINEGIIVASGSSWGREGPLANSPGFDHVGQALSGIMYEQGEGPGGEPHALIGGFALAILVPIVAAYRGPNLSFVEHSQLHGHLQTVGFVGFFIVGVGYRLVPRFTGHQLTFQPLIAPSFYLLSAGILTRFISQPISDLGPFGAIMALSGWLELAGIACFALVVTTTASTGIAKRPGRVHGAAHRSPTSFRPGTRSCRQVQRRSTRHHEPRGDRSERGAPPHRLCQRHLLCDGRLDGKGRHRRVPPQARTAAPTAL